MMDNRLRTALTFVAALAAGVLLLVLLGGLFMVVMMGAMMGGTIGSQFGGGLMMGPGMMGAMLIVAVLVIAVVVWFVVWLMRRGQSTSPQNDALATLRRRYAAGEISRDQYQQMMTDIIGSNRHAA